MPTMSMSRLVRVALILVALATIGASYYFVFKYFTPIHYWDQWEISRALANDPRVYRDIRYLFAFHNEHVIATSKILFWIDYLFFGYANYSLIVAIGLLNAAIAYVLARILLPEPEDRRFRLLVWVGFSAALASLCQWENLLVGFQTQFSLVLLFAMLAIVFATRVQASLGRRNLVMVFATLLCTFLALSSMGSGVALVFSFTFLAVACFPDRRYRMVLVVLALTLCMVPFFIKTGATIGDPALRTPYNLVLFSLAMIGGPFAPRINAEIMGLAFCLVFGPILVISILRPWLKRRPIAIQDLRLAAIAVFVLGTVAAAAWGRVTLGVGAALSSRYTTPVIVLWLCAFGMGARMLARPRLALPQGVVTAGVASIAAIIMALATGFTRNAFVEMERKYANLTRASYFALSNVRADNQMAHLYPHPALIIPSLDMLRDRSVTIYSRLWGISLPAPALLAQRRPDALSACPAGSIDAVARSTADGWTVSGWLLVGHDLRTPGWVVPVDEDGRVLGVMVPLEARPDVVAAVGRRHARGFVAPVHLPGGPVAGRRYFVLGVPPGATTAVCKVEIASRLPMTAILTDIGALPPALVPPARSDRRATNVGPVPITHADRVTDARGTWVGSDAATGTVETEIASQPGQCGPVYVPVLRGPDATGLMVQIMRNGQEVERTSLHGVTDHQWNFLVLDPKTVCPDGAANRIVVRLTDSGTGWGQWGALAAPLRAGAP